MGGPRVAIVIPALNESATIASVVDGVLRYGTVIVVDDGSTDDTAARASAGGAIVVRHEKNQGYDGALNSGFSRAAELNVDWVVTVDADGQHNASTVGEFVRMLEDGADVVIGIRDRHQRIGESLFSLATRVRWGICDPLSGMKGYRLSVWRELGHFDSYKSIGTELAIFAAAAGKRVVQVPVPTNDRVGAPKFGHRFDANMRILRACWCGMTRVRRR